MPPKSKLKRPQPEEDSKSQAEATTEAQASRVSTRSKRSLATAATATTVTAPTTEGSSLKKPLEKKEAEDLKMAMKLSALDARIDGPAVVAFWADLDRHLSSLQLKTRNVDTDGSCMFHCLSLFLFGTTSHSLLLRKLVSEHLKRNKGFVREALEFQVQMKMDDEDEEKNLKEVMTDGYRQAEITT